LRAYASCAYMCKRRTKMLTKWEKFERFIFIVGLIVVALDLLYWRP
jgi:hypothetical protein